jgi:spermidine synthase
LILGFGAGSIATILQEELHIECSIIGVEHDPVILEIFSEHFNPERFDRLQLLNDDAASFIGKNKLSFDLVCVDVFLDKEVPEECLQPEFLQKLNQAVNSSGSLIFNIIVESDEQRQKHKALKQYFSSLKGKVKERFVAPSNSVIIWEKV